MARFTEQARMGRLGAVVAASTAALTASFIGLVGLARGAVNGTTTRLPMYVLSMAAVFVAGVVVFDEARHDGREALARAGLVALATLYVVGLGGEGVVFALSNPDAVLRSQLFAYLLSAGLMGTGFGYWGWRNWQSLRPSGLSDAL